MDEPDTTCYFIPVPSSASAAADELRFGIFASIAFATSNKFSPCQDGTLLIDEPTQRISCFELHSAFLLTVRQNAP